VSLNPTTILAVDDEPSVLTLAQLTLERAGYRVLAAISAPSAIKLASDFSDSIQLLLLDIVMPEMSGPELRERLQPHLANRDVPTVYISGYPGAFGDPDLVILEKPFTGRDLVAFVQLALTPKRGLLSATRTVHDRTKRTA